MDAHQALDLLAILEEDHGGNAHHAKLTGQGFILVHVDLADYSFAVQLVPQLVDNRQQGLARLAPIGPKINHCHFAFHCLCEGFGIQMLYCHINNSFRDGVLFGF